MRSGPGMELYGKRDPWELKNVGDTSNRRKLERGPSILYINKYKSLADPKAHMYRTNPKKELVHAQTISKQRSEC